jgi:hypothetical protein
MTNFITSSLSSTTSKVTVIIEEASIASALTATSTVSADIVKKRPIEANFSGSGSIQGALTHAHFISAGPFGGVASLVCVIGGDRPNPNVTLAVSLPTNVTIVSSLVDDVTLVSSLVDDVSITVGV